MRNARIRTAFFVLSGILLLMGASVLTVRGCCKHLIVQADAVLAAADTEAAITALEQTWKRESRLLRFFIPNQQLMELNAEIMQLQAHEAADTGELAAGVCAVKADLEWMRGKELTAF